MNLRFIQYVLVFCLFGCVNQAISAAEPTGFPKFDQAVAKGVYYLKSQRTNLEEKERTLVAYALIKAGEPASSPIVQEGVHDALERVKNGYNGYDHIYLCGVDALLLSEIDADSHLSALQTIADHVAATQHQSGGWSESRVNADTSMAQYAMLALWAANNAGATVSPDVVERNVIWHLGNGTPDGSWAYRPESANKTPSHNLAMAGAGSMGIGRIMLYGPKNQRATKERQKFGVLTKVKIEAEQPGFPGYTPSVSRQNIDSRIDRAFGWINSRFPPPRDPSGLVVIFPYYFFYALERAATLYDLEDVNGKDWYETYGDILLTMRDSNGSFNRINQEHSSEAIGTSFAILYFVRSTKQILKQQYGTGVQSGNRGLDNLFSDGKKKKKELTSLGALLGAIQGAADQLDGLEGLDADEVVESVTFGSREELIGQVETLKTLLKSPDAANRQAAYFALGRTGDYELIPLMLKGLRDPNVDVAVEAIRGLRYIARKPNGFGITLDPFNGKDVDDERKKLAVANIWRDKAAKAWGTWYRGIRPYEESGGLDEIRLLATP